jgi:glycosyltransferase 2 family protein
MSARRIVIALLAALLCGGCLAYIVLTYRWQEIGALLARADLPQALAGSTVAILAYFWLRAARWHYMLRAAERPVPFARVFQATALSVGVAVLTPASAAEALKVELLKRDLLTDRVTGYTSLVAERVLDGVVLALVGLAGVYQAGLFPQSAIAPILLAGGVLGALALGIFMRLRGQRLPASVLVVTLLGWLAIGIGWHACFRSLSIEVSFAGTATVMALSTILSVLSFVPGGIGVSEVSITALLELLGVAPAPAQAGSLAIRLFGLWVLALGLALWAGARYVGNVPKTSS